MCGESNRPTVGGTIAILFPPIHSSHTSDSELSLSSSPASTASSTSSISSVSSYSLLFQDVNQYGGKKTKAIFQFRDMQTYEALRDCRYVDMRIEQHGDLSTSIAQTSPLHQFHLDLTPVPRNKQDHCPLEMGVELSERLDLNVSAKGVVGRQVTLSNASGTVLGTGIIGYN